MAAVAHRPVWTFGNHLWKAMDDAGYNQKGMAAELGVSRQLVGRWFANESFPTTNQVREWARLTNVTVAWLMEPLDDGVTPR
jgi:transcriptional regulator with XRE-family HTH domain